MDFIDERNKENPIGLVIPKRIDPFHPAMAVEAALGLA